jgi:GTP-binding protein HflX
MVDEQETLQTDIKETALLVSAYKDRREEALCKEHLQELELLCETFGIETVEKVPCFIRKYDASIFVTKGKAEELRDKAKALGVDMVIFDDEITPAQQRNLEALFGMKVLDRTEVILGVFAQRAQTKEAKLQIEIAKTRYEAPRLKRLWTHLSRQGGTAGGGGGGSGGYLKGEGEKQIEIDKRIIKDKMVKLQAELEEVIAHRNTQRMARKRSGIPIFAIIGYTNAGKSTLMNALTDAGIFVEDKLFATLDTTTRKFTLPNKQDILLIDTVGFIRKLPHMLVAAFKSTLEESIQADILLHVIDSSHPDAEQQAGTTIDVLKELGARDKSIITVLNKVDREEATSNINKLRMKYSKTVQISALNKTGFDQLIEAMTEEISKQRQVVNLKIPQDQYHLVSQVIRNGTILNQEYEENDVLITVELPIELANKLGNFVVK